MTPLRSLLSYLERAGCQRVFLVDNDSSYSPLLEFFATTPHPVIRLGGNLGHQALWEGGVLAQLGINGSFLISDPDVVPIEECPLDAIDYLQEILAAYPDRNKAGLGLRIDDLPPHYRFRDEVVLWEGQFWERTLAPRLYDAPIDTAFALLRHPGARGIDGCVRTGYPYLARHTDWYQDTEHPTDEERYYRDHARLDITHWAGKELPERLVAAINHRRRLVDSSRVERRTS